MVKRKVLAALLCVTALLVCQSGKVKEPIVKVGKTTLGSASLESFRKAAEVYPAPMPYYFPAQRQMQTIMAECEAIYQRAGSKSAEISKKMTASPDWIWKRRYYTAVLFFDLLPDNLGFTDKQLEDYYKKSTEEFRVTEKSADGQDSSYIPSFDAIKTRVADRCFYNAHKPDSAFISRLSDQDSAAVMNHWIYTVRSNSSDFFMRLFFKERTGVEYTDSLEQIVDNDKLMTSADMDIITGWLPDSRKNMRKKDLAEWLFKWLSFSEQAEKLGLTATPHFKELLHWAQRIEFTFEYLRTEVMPNLEPTGALTALDSALAELILYDNMGQVNSVNPDWMVSVLDDIAKTRTAVAVDSAVYAIRKSVGVKFLQEERRDYKDADPAALMAKADSLREAASADPDMDIDEATNIMDESGKLYQTLATDFAFTAIGRKAIGEMARTMIDKYNTNPKQQGKFLLTQAISAYRKSQKLDADPENLCNSYFLTGLAYDEYLKNNSLAEANYKWVLRNTPTCALASDAEFMIQHLGEPMTSIEEIQGQSIRQGRDVDFEEGAETDGTL
ncbi:MAG: hypothetical protein LBB74_04155 [Chitinispirillales bacterium]|jgi:hypothetical protein|nr:hypothetical protein [Chitinispirillales bacterium]